MDNMEEKLGSILGNPAMMQQIMSMAQSLGQSQPEPPKQEPPKQETPSLPDFDPGMISKLMNMAGQTNIDPNQQQLLKALRPYLTCQRIERLEKAMRAARLAGLASSFLGR